MTSPVKASAIEMNPETTLQEKIQKQALMNDPAPHPAPKHVLFYYLLIMLLGLMSPFAVSAYRKHQITQNEEAVFAVAQDYINAQDKIFEEKHEYTQELASLSSRGLTLSDMDAKAAPDYRGYKFRILVAQGNSAAGGEKSYLDDKGHMTGGFGLMAVPAKYGFTGHHTFLVSGHAIYYVDFGVQTEQITRDTTEFFVPPRAVKLK